MNVTAVGASYTTAAKQPENAKQTSQTDPSTQQVIEGSDSFTKSSAADAALLKMKESQGGTTGNGQQPQKQAPTDRSPSAKASTNKVSTEDQTNSQLLRAVSKSSSSSATDETSSTEAIVSQLSSTSSEYTAAEIAQYDTNGDGEIDSTEEAVMKAAQAKDNAIKTSSEGTSRVQTQSRDAYQTAKWQPQATQNNYYQFSYQV